MARPTFRDFAGAIMGGDTEAAGKILEQLLGLDEGRGVAATMHFKQQMAQGGPAFMGKAMGLRGAVEGGRDDEIGAIVGECFGLSADEVPKAVAALKG